MMLTQNLLERIGEKIHRYTLFLAILFLSFQMSAQTTVKGKVLDSNGMPLPGASILAKTTTVGVTTDFDGLYSIQVPNDVVTLVFSYLGYKTKEVNIDGKTEINVTLEEDSNSLEEVVVVGYGTQKKKDLTGAISSVKSDDLIMSSAPSVGHVLSGKAAGLQIVQNSAQPGGGLDILIRGAGSVNASNAPLVVVDGFPLTDFEQPESGNRYNGGTQGILNSFNPNDIESIEVLKDASSTSIYGARAANGVILITTKKGKLGKVSVEVSSSASIQSYNNEYEVLGLQDWMKLRNEAAYENWIFQNRVYPYSNRTMEEAIADPVNGVAFKRFYSDEQIRNAGQGTNWLDLITKDGAITQNNVSLRGGTEKTKYYMSGNLYDHRGVVKNSGFQRASFRLNLDQEINKYVKVGVNLTTSNINTNNSQLSDKNSTDEDDAFEKSGIIRAAIQQSPIIQAIDENGNYPINPDSAQEPNPYSLLTITDEGVINRILTNFYAEIKPIEGLVARLQYGIDKGYSNRNTYLPRTTLVGEKEEGVASIASNEKNDNLLDFTLNYSTAINKSHKLNLLLGYSQQKIGLEENRVGNTKFITDAFLWNNLNAGAGIKTTTSSKAENKFLSYFGRFNYVFKDRYILTTTLRRDGASIFAANNKFAYFPSVSIGWNVTEEKFMEKLKGTVSQLKFRYGYGQTGNASIGSSSFAAYSAGPAYLNPDESIIIGVFADRLENPDLKWETTTESNFGLDFGLWNQRISGSVEVFSKEISDLLFEKDLNSYHEVNTVWANIGKTQSKGIEITLASTNIDYKEFKWKSIFTYSNYNDRWKERAPDWKPAVYQSYDDPIRARYSYISDGIMQIDEDVPAQPDLLPGQIKLKDLNGFERDALGNPVVDDNGRFIRTGAPDGKIDQADIVMLGSTDPDFAAGLTNIFTYKNFQLNLHFNGLFGRKIVDRTDFRYGVAADGVAINGRNVLARIHERWTPDNPSTTRPASHFGYTEYDSGDFFLQDAWFIRLQNASLSYSLPQSLTGKYFQGGSIRIDAQNLFTITPYDGVDPETDAYTAAYPNVKTFTIGVDLKF